MTDTVQLIYILSGIGVLLAGFISVVYTLPRVLPYRKPIYWLLLPIAATLLATFCLGFARRFGLLVGSRTVLYVLELSLILVGLVLIVIPWIDREEARKLHQGDEWTPD